jgi:hypothetical protein
MPLPLPLDKDNKVCGTHRQRKMPLSMRSKYSLLSLGFVLAVISSGTLPQQDRPCISKVILTLALVPSLLGFGAFA